MFIKVCYVFHVFAAMQARRTLHPLSMAYSCPTWSYHHTGTLPRLISFICHSCENTGGVGVFFPFWNPTTCGRFDHQIGASSGHGDKSFTSNTYEPSRRYCNQKTYGSYESRL